MPPRVLIAGSGVAAVEAILALRHLAGRGFPVELLAPEHALVDRPASVATPFGLGAPPPLDLRELAREQRIELVEGELAAVDAKARRVELRGGGTRGYDLLLVAVGATLVPALTGAPTFRGPADVPMLEWLIGDVARRGCDAFAVVIPPGASWPLPGYELAVMAATELRMRGAVTSVTVVTAEPGPLWLFGEAAGAAVREQLALRGVRLRTGAKAERVDHGTLRLATGERLPFGATVSLPRAVGPGIPGLPSDGAGFVPADAHGRVSGLARILAAGDVTTYPVKQGGLATQQADAATETIAVELGASLVARPYTPVLRGLLLTGGAPLYLRAELDQDTGRALRGRASARALWWPPGKVAGRYLAPYLATARPRAAGAEPLVDRVSVDR